ncbi:unnamed protein product [Calypogeia fissa]
MDEEEDYEDMMKRKEKERMRQHVIDEVIPVPAWVQERFDKEQAELERKRKEEMGEYIDDTPSLTKLPAHAAQLLFSFGLEGSRRDNVAYLAPDMLAHSCGNAVHFLNIATKEQTFLKSTSGRGIGAVAVHPQRQCFAVCEKGEDPDILIYAYPSLDQKKVMKNGTERVFTAANFNNDGTRLATVGGHPDYWLTVWDWEHESMILRSKAFSQEVFKVSFSRYFPGQLITSGVGHIRFWKMASTFTGLKLEGAIAKFGTVSISDVAGYVELRNSKVLSGTESGTILVWDDSLIKAQLKRPGEFMCHDSMIEFITLNEDKDIKEMTTAGADGFIKFWKLDWLEAANDGDDKLVCEISPIREVYVGDGVHIKGILQEEDHWIIQDDGGALWKAKLPEFELEKVLEFHAGPIRCVASSPISYDLVSGGSDGTVRLYNFKQHQQRYLRKFNAGISSLVWVPLLLDPTANSVIVGFNDGVLRLLSLTDEKWKLNVVFKPHKVEVTAICFTPDAELLATGSKDATIFFFHTTDDYRALGFCKVPGPVSSIDWSPTGQDLLVGCSTGQIVELTRPGLDIDVSKSFELTLDIKTYEFHRPIIKRPKPRPEVKVVEEPKVEDVPALDEDGEEIPAVNKEGGSTETDVKAERKASKVGEARKSVKGDEGAPRKSLKGEEGAPRKSLRGEEGAPRKSSKVQNGEVTDGAAAPGADGSAVGDAQDSPKVPKVDVVPQEEEDKEDEPGTLYPVRALAYSAGGLGTFYVAYEGKPAGFIYECHMYSDKVMGFTQWLDCPVKCFRYTHSGLYVVSGSDDGMVRVQEAPTPGELQLAVTQSKFWEGPVHDGFYGVVGGVVTSFDDHYLASVSSDGSFFVQTIDMAMAPEIPKPSIPPGVVRREKEGEGEPQDLGEQALSIEEQRAKTEQDEKLKLALEKKMVVLEKVDSIRTRLAALLKEMNGHDRNEKLPLTEFEIDPHVRIMLAEETEREVDMARKEMQWDSEKRNIALSKLKAWYLDPLEVERIVLYGFRSGQTVTSFRTARLSPELQAAIEEAKRQKGVRKWSKLNKAPRSFVVPEDGAASELETEKPPLNQEPVEGTEGNKKDDEEISRLEQRRLLLKQREKEMAKYLLSKPDETWVSEEDAQAIQWAEENRGDFKLKSDPNFVVPEDLRTNHRMKRNEMLLFTAEIHNVRMTFNKEFLDLRDHKMVLREKILQNNARIEKINEALKVAGKPEPNLLAPRKTKLGSILSSSGKLSTTWKRVLSLIKDDSVFVPEIKREERPENRQDISKEEAEEYEDRRQLAAEAVVKASKTKETLGMDQSAPKKEDKPATPSANKLVPQKDREVPKVPKKQPVQAPVKGFPTSALEQQEQDITQMKLKYEKQKLEERNISIIQGFDDSVEDLKLKRFNLEINIKAAELKMMCLYQEMRYLQRIQPTEELLDEKLYQKLKGVHEITDKLNAQEKAMEDKKEQIASMIESKAQLARDFEAMFPDPEDPQKVILLKYYLKAVRQVKRNPDGTIAESDEDSDLEETAANEEEEDYEDDDVAEVCPPNVTPYFYEQMFKLREQRVNEEVRIKEANKALDALTKERDSIVKKKKLIDAALDGVEKEIASFQKEKQFSMNDIEMVLSLRMSQIEYLEDGGLPKDMSKGLVFDNTVFQQLRETIKEHLKSKHSLRKLHRDLRKEHQVLMREKKTEEEKTNTIEARCIEVQMLKFGQTVEMSVLDAISKDLRKDTVQLKERLRTQEATHTAEIIRWNKKIDVASDDLRFCTKDNAAVLHVIADIKTKQNKLEFSMKERATANLKDPLLEKRKHASHHSMLVQIITEQDSEIQRIQNEIKHLKKELDATNPAAQEDPKDASKVQ